MDDNVVILSGTVCGPSRIKYLNSPDNAARVGWHRLPEYCEGDSTAPYVIHDYKRGIFIYTYDG